MFQLLRNKKEEVTCCVDRSEEMMKDLDSEKAAAADDDGNNDFETNWGNLLSSRSDGLQICLNFTQEQHLSEFHLSVEGVQFSRKRLKSDTSGCL